jgi:hypothetical protein
MIKQNVAFDVETEGYPKETQLKMFEPTFDPDGRLSLPDKIAADIAKKTDEWCSKAALDAARGRVLAIGILTDDGVSFIEGQEPEMLLDFWKVWRNENFGAFIGHFSRGFDMPFLMRRSYVWGITVPDGVVEGRYFSRKLICTMEHWCQGTRDTISLDRLARALDVGKKVGNGADFAPLYHSNKEAALAYLDNDLRLVQGCAKKMGIWQ